MDQPGIIPEELGSLKNARLYIHGNQINGHIPGDSEKFINRPYEDGHLCSTIPNDDYRRQIEIAYKRSGATQSWRLKVVVVGAVGAGKTSIIRGLVEGKPQLCQDNDRTKGVDVYISTPVKASLQNKLEMVFWDFAGHSDYYSTHQLFLSQGALYLLVIDISRFAQDCLENRGDLIYSWLDALLCRVPGCNLLLVATQIDRLARSDVEVLTEEIKDAVEKHVGAKKREQERAFRKTLTRSSKPATIVFHGVETVSAADRDSLLRLRKKLFGLVMDKRKLFASAGSMVPVSLARASAALQAMLTGDDPFVEAWNIKPGSTIRVPYHRESGIPYLTWEQASTKWNEVVKTLDLDEETGVTDDILKAAVELQINRGMFLQSSGLIYLDPIWINGLLRAILDHDLQDPEKEDFWVDELVNFVDDHPHVEFCKLKKIHDRFCATGTLTVGYLRFLWRYIIRKNTDLLGDHFSRLLDTMSQHGLIFKSTIAKPGIVDVDHGLDDGINLFVPVRLPPRIIEDDLHQCETQMQNRYREDFIFDIYRQSYVPPGVLGLLIADFISHDNVDLHTCWSRGASFTMGGPVVLLHLDADKKQGSNKAVITANIFGQKQSGELFRAGETVQKAIETLFATRFPGILLALRGGKRHPVEREDVALERIDTLKSHIDFQVSRLLGVLGALDGKLDKVAKSSRASLGRLTKLQSKDYPYPSLVIVRGATAVVHGSDKRTLRSRFEAVGRRAKGAFSKEMRLSFLCPFDYSEVPCGLDGNGYKFGQRRNWVKALRPALQVTAVITSVAVKAGSGLTLPVSDFLNTMMEGVGEEFTDALECKALEALEATDSYQAYLQPVGRKPFADVVGQSYEQLKQFMDEHNFCCRDPRCIHFETLMEIVDDGKGGQVWVSKANTQQWRDSI